MRNHLLLILTLFVLFPLRVVAQDTIPDLIISEARMDMHPNSYFEITNMGDTALNLDQFLIQDPQGGDILYFKEGYSLAAGETYVVTNTYEEPDKEWSGLVALADQLIYQEEAGELFDLGILVDSISPMGGVFRPFGGKYGIVLWYKKSDVDSMVIDCFSWNKDESGETYKESGGLPIAGVVEPLLTNTLIRKSNITQGNLGNWDASRGTDASDSDWLLAEHTTPPGLPFTTVGNHGAYTIDVSSDHPDISIDLDNGTLTVPWGIYKGDSLIKELKLGDGMAWWYIEKPNFEDSLHTIIQTGDILQLKSFGTEMSVKELTITVASPAADMNLLFPRKNINFPDPEDPPGTVTVVGGTPFYVTQGMPVMDTIGSVGFASRVDSLYKYLEWAPNASVNILWKDGSERVDLINGDILEVTAENGDKKQYYIDVQEYNKSDNASLAAIMWPDMTEEDNWDFSWTSDTIPEFNPSNYQYNITLAYGSRKVPALVANPEDLNANVEVTPAVSLDGGYEERTSYFKVTSESDTIEQVYAVTFSIYQPPENQQKFFADPFFSEFQHKHSTITEWLEICNPGNQVLDLGNYLIVLGTGMDPAQAVQANLDFTNRYRLYVPGYRFTDDTTAWENEEYKVLKYDGSVDPMLNPNGDVFVIAARQTEKAMDRLGITTDWWDISFPDDSENKWGQTFGTNDALLTRQKDIALYLFKIENDSVLNGEKPLGDMNDLSLIDAIGYPDGTDFADIGGYDWGGEKGHKIIRKSSVWQGNPSYYESGGTNPEESEWTWANAFIEGTDWMEHLSTIGNHILDPVTAYKSTVSSLVYLVDDGYEGDLKITGISNAETVQEFIANLIIPDTGQNLVVKTGSGAILDQNDAISMGDSLIVTSADEKSTTSYLLDTAPLNSNTNLVAVDGSAITVTNEEVSGFVPGTALKDVMDGIEAESEYSIINIVDNSGALVPLQQYDYNGNYVPVMATQHIYIEVVAQNGDRKLYQLKPDSDASDAYVMSNVYHVDQENMTISGIPGGVAVSAFYNNVIAVEGASLQILDKADYERNLGNLSYDDVLKVVSADESKVVTYTLTFSSEANNPPSVSVEEGDVETEVGVAYALNAIAEDDNLSSGSLIYTWSVISGDEANVSIANSDQAQTEVTFSEEGSYVLQVTVSDGELEATATVNVTVTLTGISNTNLEFRMFPNPTREFVVLQLENKPAKNSLVSIYTLTGKQIYTRTIQNDRIMIDVNNFESGIYFVILKAGAELKRKKLIIME